MSELFVAGFILICAAFFAWALTRKDNRPDGECVKEKLDYQADYEHELTQPRWRIKLTTEAAVYYTVKFDPYLFLGTSLRILKSSKEGAEERLDACMRIGYFNTDKGVAIPTCRLLSAEVVQCEGEV